MEIDQLFHNNTEESAERCIGERKPDPTRALRELLRIFNSGSPLAPIRCATDNAGGTSASRQSAALSEPEMEQAIRARDEAG